jgi:hypothetical protein
LLFDTLVDTPKVLAEDQNFDRTLHSNKTGTHAIRKAIQGSASLEQIEALFINAAQFS